MKKQDKTKTEREVSAVTFLLPCYNTPLLTSDFLYNANELGCFAGTPFVLLLDGRDPRLNVYQEMVKNLIAKGFTVGYLTFDGTPYCGKINRASQVLNTKSVCVLDNKHLPLPTDNEDSVNMLEKIEAWQKTFIDPMTIGVFDQTGSYPVISKKLIERLGYMFHPLSYGRESAENWLISLGNKVGLISLIPDCTLIESKVEEFEVAGWSRDEDKRWVEQTLNEIFDDEVERLESYLVK